MLAEIERLDPVCRSPPKDLCERAGACEQCHGAAGMPGVVCAHCMLERRVIRWEALLFRFSARALKAGAMISEDQALEVYRQELMNGGPEGGGAAPAQRAKTGIASVSMTHQDNEHHVLLQAVVQLLRCAPPPPAAVLLVESGVRVCSSAWKGHVCDGCVPISSVRLRLCARLSGLIRAMLCCVVLPWCSMALIPCPGCGCGRCRGPNTTVVWHRAERSRRTPENAARTVDASPGTAGRA